MGEMENQAEFYYEKLKSNVNPGAVLLDFYREITGTDAGRTEIIMLNKLIKLFGRFTVYFAVMELSKYDKIEGNIYPLLFTICRNRFEKATGGVLTTGHESLDKYIKDLEKQKEIALKSKGKIPSPEGLA